jgi:prepilin-type N-terminal cleavage/methylation domain-containing protein
MTCQSKKENKGFTLVEMMVAIAVFSIVMVTAMSALLNVIDANNKARAIKTAINNVSFALEGISKDMRMGSDYACGDSLSEPDGECLSGGDIIKYKSPRSDLPDGYAYYQYNDVDLTIETCLEKNGINCSAGGPFSPITSDEVDLTNVRFYISGVESPTDDPLTQPRMVMTVSGKAGSKEKIETRFDLQTGVSQVTRP